MMELTTYTELEIAHRLGGAYSGRCLHWHGHRYEVEITVTAQKLNADGMIVDFKKLKEVVKTVLDDKWDHGACVRTGDPLVLALMEDAHHERVHIIDANPTLEWMVEHWALELQAALDDACPGVAVSMLKASETARNTVTWRCNCLPWERSENANDANDAKKPICVEEEYYVPVEDTALYFVQFRTSKLQYSTTVRTSLTGDRLVGRCYEVAREFVADAMKMVPAGTPAEEVVLLGITKLPG